MCSSILHVTAKGEEQELAKPMDLWLQGGNATPCDLLTSVIFKDACNEIISIPHTAPTDFPYN